MFKRCFLAAVAATIALVAGATMAVADDALLTVSFEDRDPVAFTRADIEALPVTRFSTSTLWTEGVVDFAGVSLADFLDAVGVEDGSLSAVAINDYAVDIPVSDAAPGGPIIAYRMNGATMSARQKGPLWIVYPYDRDVAFQSETIYSRSIWQLARIDVEG